VNQASINAKRFQKAYARFLTDPQVREALLHDPSIVKERFSLSDDEIRLLTSLEPERLHVSVDSVIGTRRRMLTRSLPATMRVLMSTEQGDTVVKEFLDTCPPLVTESGNRLLAEASRMTLYLTEARPKGAPLFAADLARYEQARLALSFDPLAEAAAAASHELANQWLGQTGDLALDFLHPYFCLGGHVMLVCFEYDVVALAADPFSASSFLPGPNPTRLVIRRSFGGSTTVVYRIGRQAFTVLDLLDGTRSLTQVSEACGIHHRPPTDLQEVVHRALRAELLSMVDSDSDT
jgi:hypothetical protein